MSFEDDEYWDDEYNDHSPSSYAENGSVAHDRYSPVVPPVRRPRTPAPVRTSTWDGDIEPVDIELRPPDELAARRRKRSRSAGRNQAAPPPVGFDQNRPDWLNDPEFVPTDVSVPDPDASDVVDFNRPELGANFDNPENHGPNQRSRAVRSRREPEIVDYLDYDYDDDQYAADLARYQADLRAGRETDFDDGQSGYRGDKGGAKTGDNHGPGGRPAQPGGRPAADPRRGSSGDDDRRRASGPARDEGIDPRRRGPRVAGYPEDPDPSRGRRPDDRNSRGADGRRGLRDGELDPRALRDGEMDPRGLDGRRGADPRRGPRDGDLDPRDPRRGVRPGDADFRDPRRGPRVADLDGDLDPLHRDHRRGPHGPHGSRGPRVADLGDDLGMLDQDGLRSGESATRERRPQRGSDGSRPGRPGDGRVVQGRATPPAPPTVGAPGEGRPADQRDPRAPQGDPGREAARLSEEAGVDNDRRDDRIASPRDGRGVAIAQGRATVDNPGDVRGPAGNGAGSIQEHDRVRPVRSGHGRVTVEGIGDEVLDGPISPEARIDSDAEAGAKRGRRGLFGRRGSKRRPEQPPAGPAQVPPAGRAQVSAPPAGAEPRQDEALDLYRPRRDEAARPGAVEPAAFLRPDGTEVPGPVPGDARGPQPQQPGAPAPEADPRRGEQPAEAWSRQQEPAAPAAREGDGPRVLSKAPPVSPKAVRKAAPPPQPRVLKKEEPPAPARVVSTPPQTAAPRVAAPIGAPQQPTAPQTPAASPDGRAATAQPVSPAAPKQAGRPTQPWADPDLGAVPPTPPGYRPAESPQSPSAWHGTPGVAQAPAPQSPGVAPAPAPRSPAAWHSAPGAAPATGHPDAPHSFSQPDDRPAWSEATPQTGESPVQGAQAAPRSAAPSPQAPPVVRPAAPSVGTPRPAQHREGTPQPAQHREAAPQPTHHREAAPQPAQHRQATPQPAHHRETTPEPAQHREAAPQPAQHRQATPQPVQHREVAPQPVQHREAMPLPVERRVEPMPQPVRSHQPVPQPVQPRVEPTPIVGSPRDDLPPPVTTEKQLRIPGYAPGRPEASDESEQPPVVAGDRPAPPTPTPTPIGRLVIAGPDTEQRRYVDEDTRVDWFGAKGTSSTQNGTSEETRATGETARHGMKHGARANADNTIAPDKNDDRIPNDGVIIDLDISGLFDGRGVTAEQALIVADRQEADQTEQAGPQRPAGRSATQQLDRGQADNVPGGNGQAGDAQAGDAHAGDAHAGDAHAGNAHAGNAHAGNAHAGNAHAGDTRAGNGQAGNGQAADAQAGNARAADAPAADAPAARDQPEQAPRPTGAPLLVAQGDVVASVPGKGPLSAADLDAIRWRLDGGTLREVVDDRDALRALGDRLDGPLADEQDDITKAHLLSVRAEVFRLLGELGMAAAASRLALLHAEKSGDARAIVIAQAELAHVLRLRGDFGEADRLFEEAASSETPESLRSVVHENAGRSCFDQGRHMEALDHFARAVRLGPEDDLDLVERIGVSLEAVYIHVLRDGWGPYPRMRREIIEPERTPEQAQD